jgi:hypothetical protein
VLVVHAKELTESIGHIFSIALSLIEVIRLGLRWRGTRSVGCLNVAYKW